MRLPASLPVGLVMGNRQSRPWIVSDELWSLIGVREHGECVVGELSERVGTGQSARPAPPAEVDREHVTALQAVDDEVPGAGGAAPVVQEHQSRSGPLLMVVSG
ncbi:hypothetical protein STENM223S_09435 [Streptomyces tendae]